MAVLESAMQSRLRLEEISSDAAIRDDRT